jgi:hypothetical protein
MSWVGGAEVYGVGCGLGLVLMRRSWQGVGVWRVGRDESDQACRGGIGVWVVW